MSLNEVERRQDKISKRQKLSFRESGKDGGKSSNELKNDHGAAMKNVRALRDDGMQPDERNLVKELADRNAGKKIKAVLLNEAVRILNNGGATEALRQVRVTCQVRLPGDSRSNAGG